jgi:hypothetical protein
LPADFSSPIEEREVVEDDIEGAVDAEVEAERGVEAVETDPLQRARDRVIGASKVAMMCVFCCGSN